MNKCNNCNNKDCNIVCDNCNKNDTYINMCITCLKTECDNCLINVNKCGVCSICKEYLCKNCIINPTNDDRCSLFYCKQCLNSIENIVFNKININLLFENIKDLYHIPKCIFYTLYNNYFNININYKTPIILTEDVINIDSNFIYNDTNNNLCLNLINSDELDKYMTIKQRNKYIKSKMYCFKYSKYPCLNCIILNKFF